MVMWLKISVLNTVNIRRRTCHNPQGSVTPTLPPSQGRPSKPSRLDTSSPLFHLASPLHQSTLYWAARIIILEQICHCCSITLHTGSILKGMANVPPSTGPGSDTGPLGCSHFSSPRTSSSAFTSSQAWDSYGSSPFDIQGHCCLLPKTIPALHGTVLSCTLPEHPRLQPHTSTASSLDVKAPLGREPHMLLQS